MTTGIIPSEPLQRRTPLRTENYYVGELREAFRAALKRRLEGYQ
jgi:hypothetical protein